MVVSVGMATLPVVGFCSPAIIFSNVDFPAPFFPTSAMWSLSLTTKLTSWNRGFTPNSTLRFSIEIISSSYFCLYFSTTFFIESSEMRQSGLIFALITYMFFVSVPSVPFTTCAAVKSTVYSN